MFNKRITPGITTAEKTSVVTFPLPWLLKNILMSRYREQQRNSHQTMAENKPANQSINHKITIYRKNMKLAMKKLPWTI
jgi:hypothetical protein